MEKGDPERNWRRQKFRNQCALRQSVLQHRQAGLGFSLLLQHFIRASVVEPITGCKHPSPMSGLREELPSVSLCFISSTTLLSFPNLIQEDDEPLYEYSKQTNKQTKNKKHQGGKKTTIE